MDWIGPLTHPSIENTSVGKTIRLCAHIYGLTILLPVPLVAPLACLEYAKLSSNL